MTEWSVSGQGSPPVPRELRDRMRWRFTTPAPVNLTGSCARIEHTATGIILFEVLLDTSERARGIVLTSRMTYRDVVTFVHVPVVIVALNLEEHSPDARPPL